LELTIGEPHGRVSADGPEHGAPHKLPAIQPRVLVCVPIPHFTEHALHPPYPPHLEFTIGVPQGRVSLDGPEHGAPQELPLVHDRDLVCVPIPHFTEHALQAPYPPHLESTIAVPQGRVSVDGPEHGAPQELPRVHDRDLVCVPIPHFTEHALQAPYPPHLESTIAEPQDLVSVDGPEHGAPHALPLIQGRDLVCVPIPHLTEHALQAPYPPHLELTIAVPHDFVSTVGPLHGLPQGSTLTHERVRVIVPIPHFCEHALHGPNAPI